MTPSSKGRFASLTALALAIWVAFVAPAFAADWPSSWSVERNGANVTASSPALANGRRVIVVADDVASTPEPLRDWFEARLAGTLAIGEVRGRSGFDSEGTLIKHSFEVRTATDTWVKVHGFAYETPSGKQIFQVFAPAELPDDDPLIGAALDSIAGFWRGEMALAAGASLPASSAAATPSPGAGCRLEMRTVTVSTMQMICGVNGCGMRFAPAQQQMQQQVCD